jgi:hypothetical protein
LNDRLKDFIGINFVVMVDLWVDRAYEFMDLINQNYFQRGIYYFLENYDAGPDLIG